MFHETQNQEYLQLILDRAKNGPVLTWVEQVLDILESEFAKGITLNDVGCCSGVLYKGIKERKACGKIDYIGYDIEPLYIEKAVEIFPELKGKLFCKDITKQPLEERDVTICSATLEHIDALRDIMRIEDCPALLKTLGNIFNSARKMVILRTFLGADFEYGEKFVPGAERPYPIVQFPIEFILEQMKMAGFNPTVHNDRHTDSFPLPVGKKVIRAFYIIVGKKTEEVI